MLAALERMSRSEDWVERVRAARLVARLDPGASEAIVERLLTDDRTPVAEAMVTALLHARRETAIPLVLRTIGRRRAVGQALLEGLLNSELDGVDVRGTIIAVLLAAGDRDEIVGALGAIAWLAPSGGFQAPPEAFARVMELSESDEQAVRVLAAEALVALAR